MKREALEARLENENAYMEQVDLTLAAAAAAAAHHHNATGLHHPNSRHHDLENNLHKGNQTNINMLTYLMNCFTFKKNIFFFILFAWNL